MIVVDLGVDEGDGSSRDVNTTTLQQHSTEGSGKLPATGRWRNVPGKVQIDGSHPFCGIRVNSTILKVDSAGSADVHTPSLQQQIPQGRFQETSRNGAMEERSEKGLNLAAISPAAKHGRPHVNSRKLPATGRWGNVPGKVQIQLPHQMRNSSKFRNPQT
jgi:hypothetical protein